MCACVCVARVPSGSLNQFSLHCTYVSQGIMMSSLGTFPTFVLSITLTANCPGNAVNHSVFLVTSVY